METNEAKRINCFHEGFNEGGASHLEDVFQLAEEALVSPDAALEADADGPVDVEAAEVEVHRHLRAVSGADQELLLHYVSGRVGLHIETDYDVDSEEINGITP